MAFRFTHLLPSLQNATTSERLTFGIVDANFWHRKLEVAEKNAKTGTARDRARIEEKDRTLL